MTFLDAYRAPLSQAPGQPDEERQEGYEIERDVLLDMLFDEVKDDVEFLFADSIAGLGESAEEVSITFTSGKQRIFLW